MAILRAEEPRTFTCRPNCGWCCSIIMLISHDIVQRNKDKFQVKATKILDTGYSYAINTADGKCIFLNRTTKLCAIHDDKPENCQRWGNVDERGWQCPYRTKDSIERLTTNVSVQNDFQKQMDKSWKTCKKITRAKEVTL